jgi:DNA polymerase I
MRSLTFADWPSHPLVYLVPQLRKNEIQKEYLNPFNIPLDDVKCLSLHFEGKKTPVEIMKRYIADQVIPELVESNTQYVVCADAGYYKVITGQAKADLNLGYVQPFVFDGITWPWQVVYVPSFRQVFYDPENTRAKIAQSTQALLAHIEGTYNVPGNGIIHFEEYPQTDAEIETWLNRLLEMNCDLAIDTETFDLKHHKAGIGTISFAWSKHEGIAFPVDYAPITHDGAPKQIYFGEQIRNEHRRLLLKRFFMRYLKKAIYHNISFDVYNLVYQLFMQNLLDTQGLLEGMQVLLRNWDDTQLITYLATNSCAGNKLGLKANSQEFSGNYAMDDEDIKDIRKIPLNKLLRYNLIDTLSTWFVYEKHQPRMVQDNQLEIYETLFKPSTWDIIQMQLTGMPLDMERVKQVKLYLEAIQEDALKKIYSTATVQQFTYLLQEKYVEKRNAELKKKRICMTDPETLAQQFNPNSGVQLQELLYEMLSLPVLDYTQNKNPATGGDTLEKLIHHTESQDVKNFLQAVLDYGAVNKLLTAFIPAFENAALGPDGWHYLFGSFKLGGTLSGRLSASNPNLQQLPANIEMLLSEDMLVLFPALKKFVSKGKLHLGKLIKSCFAAPPGWVFCGLDFSSLEDRISALTTKDPNKIKVYVDGYDGHSLRAYAYFGDQMPDINPNSVESINSIQKLYPKQRQLSKGPTFAKTYQGTWMTLVKNCGFDEATAKKIDANFDQLYKVSIDWVQAKLNQAGKDGYITAAFGLRIRTPLLAQVVRGNSRTPHEAEAEGRSAGNALGQSWCLLTNRASAEFMGKMRSGPYQLDIRPCAHIHDAQYMMVRDDADTLLYVNEHLVQAVQWQEHPDIQHPEVRLGGTLSVFWPNWSYDIEIPNGADESALKAALEARLEKKT